MDRADETVARDAGLALLASRPLRSLRTLGALRSCWALRAGRTGTTLEGNFPRALSGTNLFGEGRREA